ncbi:unnamed protein product [Cuscuta europaea]|uniref:Uncharacterized protein n=1 Tax=Cuscuta europaea TaxID=41803 RepID=A0A9P0ZTM8_CUSEU|nr:unnamed protein product [Cuscuta europaea]
MCQAMPSADRLTFARMSDEGLNSRIRQNSASAFMGLCEQLRRVDQLREAKLAGDGEIAALIRKLTEAEDALWLTNESVEQRVQAARAEGKDEGLAEVGEAATEAARKATDEAKAAKEEAATKAREDSVAAFTAEGWKTEGHKEWLASVVEASVDALVGGPDKMWLAVKGDSYYQGGEFFTQRLIYRKLDQHFNILPEEFQPEAYGLPRQPDVRIPLPQAKRGLC